MEMRKSTGDWEKSKHLVTAQGRRWNGRKEGCQEAGQVRRVLAAMWSTKRQRSVGGGEVCPDWLQGQETWRKGEAGWPDRKEAAAVVRMNNEA